MILKKERELVVKYGLKLINRNLTKGTGGNLSLFSRKKGLVAISPSALNYDKTSPEDVSVIDLNGNIVEGEKKPSSELEMHLLFYKKRKDIKAVIHTHSIYATTISCLRHEIPAIHYLIGFAGQKVPCASYATNTTLELAKNSLDAMGNGKAVLLANHGLLACGKDLSEAFNIAEITEFCAELFYRAKSIGDPVLLNNNEMDEIMKTFKTYGK